MRGKLWLRIVLLVVVMMGGFVLIRQQTPKTGTITLNVPTGLSVGQVFEVPLTISVPTAINAGEFVFTFPTDLLAVKEIKKDGSFYQLWVTDSPSFSNTDGTISLAGGLPSPGITGEGLVATIVFEVKKAGTAQITLDESKSRLLANDGLGTVVPAKFNSLNLRLR